MKIPVPAVPVHYLALGWTSTWRLTRLHQDRLEQARRLAPSGAAVGVFWHQSLLMASACHHNMRVAAMISRSLDGELIAAHLQRVGIRAVRGSSRRGGSEAAREMMRAVDEGYMLAIACDGPTGPAYRPKPGLFDMAVRCQIPVLPLGFGALGFTDIAPAWDRFRIPWLGTRVAVSYGEPISFPPGDPSPEERERRVALVTARIQELQREAMSAVGRR